MYTLTVKLQLYPLETEEISNLESDLEYTEEMDNLGNNKSEREEQCKLS